MDLLNAETERRARVRRYDWRGHACPFHTPEDPFVEGSCLHGRPGQVLPDGDWRVWAIMAGRGWGKTRTGAEAVREWSERYSRIGLIAPTKNDAREVMVEGASGILSAFPPDRPARYIANRLRVEFPSGSIGTVYTADEPERLRGPQHTKLWADELAAWRYPEAWTMAMFGLRLGDNPQVIATYTPKPTKLVKELRDRARLDNDPHGRVLLQRGSTYDNRLNLAPSFLSEIVGRYEGTRLGRQELHAEVLEDVEGALWSGSLIEPYRVPEAPDMVRVVVAVDPAVTHGEDSDATGLVVAGKGVDGDYYVLSSDGLRVSPETWARRTLYVTDQHGADCIVAEVNQGGDLVTLTLRNVADGRPVPRIKKVHAKKGKVLRAEPVVALYEQGKVHHVGSHDALEDQQTSFPIANDHDDLVDAVVYALTELSEPVRRVTAY